MWETSVKKWQTSEIKLQKMTNWCKKRHKLVKKNWQTSEKCVKKLQTSEIKLQKMTN